MRELTLILDEDSAELEDADGDSLWHSDDDNGFDYGHDTTEAEVIAHLLAIEKIDEEGEISQTVDERADADENDDDDDDDAEDFDEDED